jgi:membrane protein
VPWWKRTSEILKVAVKEYGDDKAGRLAASLAYYTIFSLVPLLFLAVAVSGIVLDDENTVGRLVQDVREVAGEAVADALRGLLAVARDQARATLSIGLALAAFSASGIFLQVQGVLNVVFHVPNERVKGITGLLVQRGVALVSALALAILVLAPVAAVAAVGWLSDLVPAEAGWIKSAMGLGVPVISLLLLMAVVGLTFQALTRVKVPWTAAWRGGAATAVIGLAAAYLVGLYLTRIGSGGTLGALGGLAILLFFFNMMWTVYLLGAEVTKVYADYLVHGDVVAPGERSGAPEPEAPAPVTGREVVSSGVFAFVAGALLGFLGRRR